MQSVTGSWLAIGVFAIALSAMSPMTLAEDKPVPTAPKAYSSPRAVFDAFREAYTKRDWHTVFYCQTPDVRDNLVFEAYFGCHMHPDNPKVLAVLKKYGAESSTIDAEYYKRHKKKFGVDLGKLTAEREVREAKAAEDYFKKQGKSAPQNGKPEAAVAVPDFEADIGPPLPAVDQKIFREVVVEQIADKTGFYAAANEIIASSDSLPPIGKLEQLTIRDDAATGRANNTIYVLAAAPGKAPRKMGQTFLTTFHFRKLNGGWLIDK